MKKVWILFSIANEYNQPEKAFEKLWWHKPTYDELKEHGFTQEESESTNPSHKDYGNTGYWIECFEES